MTHVSSGMLSHDLRRNRIQVISKFTRSDAFFPTRVQNLRFLASQVFFKALVDAKWKFQNFSKQVFLTE